MGLNIWTAIKYLVFDEGKKGLVIGRNGWFFSDEEFIVAANGEQALEDNLNFIDQASQQLASRGVDLIVVLIPSKARLLASQTGRHHPATLHTEIYSKAINRLGEANILTVDGLLEMRAHTNSESLYLKTDTHWTPRGAEFIASRTAAVFFQYLPQLSLDQQTFVTETLGEQFVEGDLLRFLPLTPLFNGLVPVTERIDINQTYSSADDFLFESDGLTEQESAEVVLLGTSFSADRRWNFDGALKQALAVDIHNLAVQGQGPIEPMANFLNQYLPSADNLKLVIWEIPERYLPVAY
jgi:alginate O-acetyltransferase complex protein AlgJ